MIVNPFDWGRLLQNTATPPAIFAAVAPTKKSATQPLAAASAASPRQNLEEILAEVTAIAASVVGAEVGNSSAFLQEITATLFLPNMLRKFACGSGHEVNY